MNLYQINAEIERLENACEDGLEFEYALEQLRMERAEKIENIALQVKNFAAIAAAIRAEEESLAKRREALETKINRNKRWLANTLIHADGKTERIISGRCMVSVRNNPPKVVVTNELDIPKNYITETVLRKVDKAQLKEVLARGIEVPGARLEQTRSVMIK